MIQIEYVSESEYVYRTRVLGLSPIPVEECPWLTFLGKQVPVEPNLGLETWDLGLTLCLWARLEDLPSHLPSVPASPFPCFHPSACSLRKRKRQKGEWGRPVY